MHLDLELDLYIHTQSEEITIHPRSQAPLKCGRPGEITLRFPGVDTDATSDIPLFRLEIQEGLYQRVTVLRMRVFGAEVMDHGKFCLFHTRLNRYTPDQEQHTSELSYNGQFLVHPRGDIQQWTWFPHHWSAERDGFVAANWTWDCDSDHNCDGLLCLSTHTNRWLNLPHDPAHARGDGTPLLAVGCSFTAGTALPRGAEWPNLLSDQSIKVAFPGAGIDACWLNMERALEKFRPERVIVCLPSHDRRLWRFRRDGRHFRLPVGVHTIGRPDPWIWNSWRDVDRDLDLVKRDIVTNHARLRDRNRIIMARMVRSLEAWGGRYWFTTWDDEVHDDLQGLVDPDHRLPAFPRDESARDQRHTSAMGHRQWAESVRHRVGMGDA